VIAGLGTAVPDRIVDNAELEARLDTTDQWIVERTGIRQRRHAGSSDTTSSLAAAAGAAAIKDAGLVPDDIDLLVVATVSPDQRMPATSAYVQDALGLECGAFDVGAACAGFVYGLVAAARMVEGHALVIGVERLTSIVDPEDRGTAILFGDGAGAAVVEPGDGLVAWDLGCDGSAAHLLVIPPGERYVKMEGRELFRRAVRVVVDSSAKVLDRAGVDVADVDWFVPHQANGRIIEAAADRLGNPSAQTVVNVDRYGNTSAASIPLALADAPIKPGDLVLLSGFGAGMTWASALIRWGSAR
jgi:3-oxoacyl-[acyl-carrier-protein] synthase-3